VRVMHHATRTLTDRDVETLAREADVDPRTVVRRLAGLPVRGRVGVRVDRAIAARLGDHAEDSNPPPRAA